MSNKYLFPIATQASEDQSELSFLKKENEQLKKQLESMTNKCAEINFDKNCLISDLREMGKDLFHLRDHNKNLAEQTKQLKQQLAEAINVIEFYGKEENWIRYGRDFWNQSSPKEHGDKELIRHFQHSKIDCIGSILVGGKRARQFLAKYLGET